MVMVHERMVDQAVAQDQAMAVQVERTCLWMASEEGHTHLLSLK